MENLEELVKHNLELMRSNEDGGMAKCLLGESIGGNAGSYNGNPCAGANFFCDLNSGKIMIFGNPQDVDEEIRDKYSQGILRIMVDLKGRRCSIIDHYTAPLSEMTRKVLVESIRAYNEIVG